MAGAVEEPEKVETDAEAPAEAKNEEALFSAATHKEAARYMPPGNSRSAEPNGSEA